MLWLGKKLQDLLACRAGIKSKCFFILDPLMTIKNSELVPNSSNQLGVKVKYLRKQQNITQGELAKRIGTTKNYISKVENSKTDIEFKTLQKIFEVG